MEKEMREDWQESMKQQTSTHFPGYVLEKSHLMFNDKKNKIKNNFLHIFIVKSLESNMQGVANRGCSVRVGRDTEKQGKGITTYGTSSFLKGSVSY